MIDGIIDKFRKLGTPVIALLCMLYILSPIDIIPDFIPVVGWLDDLAVGALGFLAVLKGGPK